MALTTPSQEILLTLSGSADERREMAERIARERAAARQSELDAQTSSSNAPHQRIQIWERLHALRLPQAPGHVLVEVIAKQTRLTIEQVREEQQRRRSGAPVPPSTSSLPPA